MEYQRSRRTWCPGGADIEIQTDIDFIHVTNLYLTSSCIIAYDNRADTDTSRRANSVRDRECVWLGQVFNRDIRIGEK
jgi:hypothetical protein